MPPLLPLCKIYTRRLHTAKRVRPAKPLSLSPIRGGARACRSLDSSIDPVTSFFKFSPNDDGCRVSG